MLVVTVEPNLQRRRPTLWVEASFQLYHSKEEAYWTSRLEPDGVAPPLLWRSLSSVLGRDRGTAGATDHGAEEFAAFFARRAKSRVIQQLLRHETAPVSLSSFQLCTEADVKLLSDVRRIILSSPVKILLS